MVADSLTGDRAAMKVVKSATHYTEAARDEVQLLQCARDRDSDDAFHCCRLLDHFDHSGPHGRHVCMVFEVLGDNLLALIRAYNHRGIPMPVVRHLAHQILVALDFLHTTCGIIHTDLKPENVMMKEPLKERAPAKLVAPAPAAVPSKATSGKIAAALAAGQPLTKNQKKKLRKKLQAKDGGEGEDTAEPSGSEVTTTTTTQEESSGAEPQSAATEVAEVAATVETAAEAAGPPSDEAQPPAEATAANDTAAAAGVEAAALPSEARDNGAALSLDERLLGMTCKVVDFGNACWVHKHFTDDIQTRQYRAPEVRKGRNK